MSSTTIGTLKARREFLRRQFAAGMRGLEASRTWTRAMDDAVRALWEAGGPPPGGWAVVALGSYGRAELCPMSDVDLLILHHPSVRVEEPAKRLSYSLWDAGLELGLNVATPRESLKLAAASFDSRTAYLDGRLLEGDQKLFEGWTADLLDKVRGPRRSFLKDLHTACRTRWDAAGDAGAELEPNLKEGKGALRDVAAVLWIGKATGNSPAPDLTDAVDFLLSVRQGLHWLTGRRTDVLVMQHHGPVAARLGTDEEQLMRSLYRHCRKVAFVLEALFEPEFPLAEAASIFSRSFSGTSPQRWDAEARRVFFEIITAGARGRRAFRSIEHDGSLARALPAWRHVICLPQRNIYHRWAVDVHSFECAAKVMALRDEADGLLGRVAADSRSDFDLLALSALLHDVGKGTGLDHTVAGEKLAAESIDAMGLAGPGAGDVVWLVRNHLLLSETAVRRDIGDERLIVEVADRIGSAHRLRMLFLLTAADAMATGPEAWTDWKSHLVSQLFVEVSHLLEQGELVGGGASQKAAARSEQLREGLARFLHQDVDRHLADMPREWLLSQSVEGLLRQSEIMLAFGEDQDIDIHPVARKESGSWEVTVVARDRPALFSKVAGALAVHGLNVLSAHIFTRADGLALEVFGVEAVSQEPDRFKRVAEDARKALIDGLPIQEILAAKRRDYAARAQKGKGEPPAVVVDNLASDFYTIVEVHAPDRIGLLYSVTAELAAFGLDIHLAKVATYAHDVVDSFYVRDLDGQKVTDPARIDRMKQALLGRLSQEAPS